jgi:hypothetical protein
MFQNIFSKMTTITNLEFFQSILSFLNAVFCVYFMYKYNETNDLKYFKYTMCYVILPFLIIDLALNVYLIMNKTEKKSCMEAIFHHIITLLLILWANLYGAHHLPDVVCNLVMFESSSIFLNIRFWIREYLKVIEGKTVPNFVTILQNVNELLFFIFFIYFRCYVFLKDIIFNKSVYETLIGSGIFVNKIFIGVIFVFLLLNFYWSFIICKSGYKKINNMVNDKYKNDYEDHEIILIEKIKAEIINSRLNDKC